MVVLLQASPGLDQARSQLDSSAFFVPQWCKYRRRKLLGWLDGKINGFKVALGSPKAWKVKPAARAAVPCPPSPSSLSRMTRSVEGFQAQTEANKLSRSGIIRGRRILTRAQGRAQRVAPLLLATSQFRIVKQTPRLMVLPCAFLDSVCRSECCQPVKTSGEHMADLQAYTW